MVYTNAVRSRKRFTRFGLPLLLAGYCLVSPSPASGSQAPGVRPATTLLSALIEEGASRSTSFRGLLDRITDAQGIVYVEFGHCAFGHLNGCLLPYVVPTTGGRYLRILVTSDPTRVSHDRLIALIAHELQHALEVLAHPEVVDVETMRAMFARIGRPLEGRAGYETSEAHAAEDAVLSELTPRRRRPLT